MRRIVTNVKGTITKLAFLSQKSVRQLVVKILGLWTDVLN